MRIDISEIDGMGGKLEILARLLPGDMTNSPLSGAAEIAALNALIASKDQLLENYDLLNECDERQKAEWRSLLADREADVAVMKAALALAESSAQKFDALRRRVRHLGLSVNLRKCGYRRIEVDGSPNLTKRWEAEGLYDIDDVLVEIVDSILRG